jgi:hypothetical protein
MHPVVLAKNTLDERIRILQTRLITVVSSAMSCSITRTFDADGEGTGKPCCSHHPALPSGQDPNDNTTDTLLKKNTQCFVNHVYSKSGLT